MIFSGRKILIGITGSIAAYKACEIIRSLQKQGAQVRAVLTQSGSQMIGAATLQALTEYPVSIEAFDQKNDMWFRHIELARWADTYIIAPCTANTIAHLASGATPDALNLIWLATKAKKMIAPAMNTIMWENPSVQRNVKILKSDGIEFIEPEVGRMACGEIGSGKLADVDVIVDAIEHSAFPHADKGLALLSMGRTEEPIDPVRYITNKSSGKTGIELARELRKAGFAVKVVSGPCETRFPTWLSVQKTRTVDDMQKALEASFDESQILIMAASVADFKVSQVATQKLKGSRSDTNLELSPTPDLLRTFCNENKNLSEPKIIVGFALETETPIEHGLTKLKKKKCDLLMLNTPLQEGSGIGHDSVQMLLLEKKMLEYSPQEIEENLRLELRPKSELAQTIVNAILTRQS
ncbi:bifunctional phosphopantothenoylcysteine decarboxylase/phosphopantothenate--cysteine ligase CoaBC [Fibrobacterales bacterium]|nr:bifunctional phosphopantothenoylcysteine decarboxylase/phosphopantothenate--cysteine ligase CoaBC [Fibrobacterales bacterium]